MAISEFSEILGPVRISKAMKEALERIESGKRAAFLRNAIEDALRKHNLITDETERRKVRVRMLLREIQNQAIFASIEDATAWQRENRNEWQ